MNDQKCTTIDAPSVASQVITFRNDGDMPPVVIVENLDGVASAAIKFQERDSGAWVDITGTSTTVNPGNSNIQLLATATLREIALHAGGNVKLLVTVIRQEDGEVSDLGNIR